MAAVAAIGLIAVWRSLTLYSNVDPGPMMDPRELALTRLVLTRVLAGDSAMVRGWSRASETHSRAQRGDTVIRTWFTTAAMQRCTGAAVLTARLVHERERLRLTELRSPCVPVAPITFEVGPDTTR